MKNRYLLVLIVCSVIILGRNAVVHAQSSSLMTSIYPVSFTSNENYTETDTQGKSNTLKEDRTWSSSGYDILLTQIPINMGPTGDQQYFKQVESEDDIQNTPNNDNSQLRRSYTVKTYTYDTTYHNYNTPIKSDLNVKKIITYGNKTDTTESDKIDDFHIVQFGSEFGSMNATYRDTSNADNAVTFTASKSVKSKVKFYAGSGIGSPRLKQVAIGVKVHQMGYEFDKSLKLFSIVDKGPVPCASIQIGGVQAAGATDACYANLSPTSDWVPFASNYIDITPSVIGNNGLYSYEFIGASASGVTYNGQSNSGIGKFSSSLLPDQGSSGPDVVALQSFLTDHGYLSADNNTGYYGTVTAAAVARYRASQSSSAPANTNCPAGYICQPALPLNGTSTPATSTPSTGDCYQFTLNLDNGSSGHDVVALQRFLIDHGFAIPAISAGITPYGYFGQQTKNALVQYQSSAGIGSEYGIVGPMTRMRLNSCPGASPHQNSAGYISNGSATLGSPYIVANKTLAYPVSFKFNITSGNSPLFFNPFLGVGFYSSSNAVAPIDPANVIANPGTLAGDLNIGSNSGYYVIPAGSTRQFTVTTTMRNPTGPSGLTTMQIGQIGVQVASPSSILSGLTNDLTGLRASAYLDSGQGTSTSTSTSPTATFTIEGQHSHTYQPGQINHYVWSSTNADSFSSSYTSAGGIVCGSGPWIANTASGHSESFISSAYLGCVWTVTYRARNSITGQSASDTVTVSVGSTTPDRGIGLAVLSGASAQLGAPIMNNNIAVGYAASFQFTLTSGGSTLYVSPTSLATFATSYGTTFSNPSVTVGPGSLAGDTASYFVIPAGTSRTFTLNGVIRASGATGQRNVSLSSINYGSSPTALTAGTIVDGLQALRLSATLGDGTSPPAAGAPTANFTIEGQHSYTYTVGQTNHYVWSSTNADSFSSSYTSTGPSSCGSGPWVANTANGNSSSYISSSYAGCVWTITYTVRNSQTGTSASDTVVVTVQSDQSSGTATVSGSNMSAQVGSPISSNNQIVGYPISFTFTLSASGGLAYIYPSSLATIVASAGATFSTPDVTASPSALSGDTSYYLVIPNGVSRSFTLTGIVRATGDMSLRTVNVSSINYSTSPSQSVTGHITDGLSALRATVNLGSTPPPPPAAPTATFTIEGAHTYTYTAGATNHYVWSSTNADTFSSSYTSTGGAVCGSGGWVANSASGQSSSVISTSYIGCVWTVTYTARNSQTGQSASDTVTVRVVAPGNNNASAAYDAWSALQSAIQANVAAWYAANPQ